MTKTATKKPAAKKPAAKKATKKTTAAKAKPAAKKPAAKKATKKPAAKKANASDPVVEIDRRAVEGDRRDPKAVATAEPERRKVARRRQIDPTTCERDYSGTEIEFMQAMDAYKRTSGRMFPTCSEILEVVRSLGYYRPGEELEVTTNDVIESEESLDDAGDDSDLDLE